MLYDSRRGMLMSEATSSIRARSIVDILDSAFRLYRGYVSLLLGLSAIMLLPLTLLHIASLLLFDTATVIQILQGLVVVNVVSGALIYAAAMLYQQQSVTRREAYRVGWRRVGTIVAAGILMGLLIGVPFAIVFG